MGQALEVAGPLPGPSPAASLAVANMHLYDKRVRWGDPQLRSARGGAHGRRLAVASADVWPLGVARGHRGSSS